MTTIAVDVLGWIGAASLLSAYAFVSSGRLEGSGLGFQLLNLLSTGRCPRRAPAGQRPDSPLPDLGGHQPDRPPGAGP